MNPNQKFFSEMSESIARYRPIKVRGQIKITSSFAAEKICRDLYNGDIYDIERFYVVFLNRQNEFIQSTMLSQGGIVGTVVDIKKLFREALICKATAMLVTHNHPSEHCHPSEQDNRITNQIVDAGKIMDIQLIDHIIIAGDRHYSYRDERKI